MSADEQAEILVLRHLLHKAYEFLREPIPPGTTMEQAFDARYAWAHDVELLLDLKKDHP